MFQRLWSLLSRLLKIPPSKSRELDQFFRAFVASDDITKPDMVFQHPVLLSPEAWSEAGRRLGWAGERAPAEVRHARDWCLATLNALAADTTRYPIGVGPLEQIFMRVKQDELSLEGAEQQIRNSGITEQLSAIYVRCLSYWTQRRAVPGEWRPARDMHRLMLAAVDARRAKVDRESFEMRIYATLAWLDIVARATTDVPDGRLFRDALQRGRALQQEAEQRGDRRLRSEVLKRLGVLHLDPYMTGRVSGDYPSQIRQWKERLDKELDISLSPQQRELMAIPEPAEAFTDAIDLLTEAAREQTGLNRARTLKALAEAQFWRSVAGKPPDRDEILHTIEEAISLFNPQQHQPEVSSLIELRKGTLAQTANPPVGQPEDASETRMSQEFIERILALPVHEIKTEHRDLVSVVNMLLAVAERETRRAPEHALQIWEKCFDLSQTINAFEDFRKLVLSRGLVLFRECCRRDDAEPGPELNLATAARRLEERSRTEGWTEPQYTDAAIALAVLGGITDREEDALAILESLHGKQVSAAHRRESLVAFLRQTLRIGAAVNALRHEAYDEAARYYLTAVPLLLPLGLHGSALNLLGRVEDVIPKLRNKDFIEVISRLIVAALPTEDALGPPAIERIQSCCNLLFAKMHGAGTANATEILFLRQTARGLRLAASLRHGIHYDPQADPEGRNLLDRIAAIAAGLPPGGTGLKTAILEKETLLSAYVGSANPEAGSDDRQVLANLRGAYDTHVAHRLLGQARAAIEVFQTPEDLQGRIGESSVLLIHFTCLVPDGAIILYAFVITRERIEFIGKHLGEQSGNMYAVGQNRSRINLLGVQVSLARAAIQKKPSAGQPISQDGREILRSLAADYIGPSLRGLLDELHGQGKNHLCIAPEGALHFFPFHLLEIGGETLASRWIVTYLPNLMLLVPESVPHHVDSGDLEPLTAFGVDFQVPRDPRLPPLPGATKEAKAVASLFGKQAVVGPSVTRQNLLDGLGSSRRIHIATHGRHQTDAPFFQCLYVPEGAGYAPMHAYDVLGADLRHVDLLTLSACETALGRFDLADNLRGLPASFLLSGVRTIVGTLWEVETNAAERFFTALYRALHSGSTKLAAFAEAQRQTRETCPEYRDWGCFYMVGDMD
jgi:hypothetical protein